MATCNKLPSHVDPPESGRPDVIFTRENVGSLAAEIGVFDEQKIEDLLEQITTAAYWHIYGVWNEKHKPKMTRSQLKIVEKKSNDLLIQLKTIDDHTKSALAAGFCRAGAAMILEFGMLINVLS